MYNCIVLRSYPYYRYTLRVHMDKDKNCKYTINAKLISIHQYAQNIAPHLYNYSTGKIQWPICYLSSSFGQDKWLQL